MKNRVDALFMLTDNQRIMLPTEYLNDDSLACETPKGMFTVACDEPEKFSSLLALLANDGIVAYGCFCCRYFFQAGATEDLNDQVGYCLEGKLGKHVNPLADLTSKERSCDAFESDAKGARLESITAWKMSIGRAG